MKVEFFPVNFKMKPSQRVFRFHFHNHGRTRVYRCCKFLLYDFSIRMNANFAIIELKCSCFRVLYFYFIVDASNFIDFYFSRGRFQMNRDMLRKT